MNKKKEMKKKKEKRDRYEPPAPHCVAGPNSQWKSKERSLYILILHGLRGELNVCGFYIAADHQCSPATGREMVHLTMKRNTFHWITILANLFIATFIHPSLLWDFFSFISFFFFFFSFFHSFFFFVTHLSWFDCVVQVGPLSRQEIGHNDATAGVL